MIIEDFNFNNRMFIEDDIFTGIIKFAINTHDDNTYRIIRDDDIFFNVNFINDKNFILNASAVKFDNTFNNITIYGQNGATAIKSIGENDIIKITNTNNNLNIEINEVPEFMNYYESNDTYPKFDIQISDCYYKVKIYVSDSEVIDIPYFRSHDNIIDTLEHIYSMVYYFTKIKPNFMRDLCNCNTMLLHIEINGKEDTSLIKYELGDDHISLIDNEETKLVQYHTFFKLIMDNKWDVTFIDETLTN